MTTVTLDNVRQLLAEKGSEVIAIAPIFPLRRRKFFILCKPLRVCLSTGQEIELPEGLETDLSSVPRWLWSIAPPFGDFLLAALIHDFLYIHNIGTRKQADREMLIWSNAINGNRFDNRLRYIAVRLFGQSWWDS